MKLITIVGNIIMSPLFIIVSAGAGIMAGVLTVYDSFTPQVNTEKQLLKAWANNFKKVLPE